MSDALLSKRSKVLRFFPVPRYLALGAVACFIDRDVFRFIELRPQGRYMMVRRHGEKVLPSSLSDDSDEVPAELKKAVAKIISDEKFFSVSIVIPERFVYVFFITIPIVEPSLIHDALAFSLEEHIPIPPAEVIFEFDIIKRDERAGKMTIAVRAVARRQIEKYTELFSGAGALVVQCETEGRATLSSALAPFDSTCRLIIKIGTTETVIFIAQGVSVLFNSSIPVGSEKITGVNEASLPTLSAIKAEAGKVMEYWNSRPDADNTGRATSVLLFGSAGMSAGVREYFEAALSSPVMLANVWQNAFSLDEIMPDINAQDAQNTAAVIGLSLSQ